MTNYYILHHLENGNCWTVYQNCKYDKIAIQKAFDDTARLLNIGEGLEYGKETDEEITPYLLHVEMTNKGLIIWLKNGRFKKYTPKS